MNPLGNERCDVCDELWYLCSCDDESDIDPLDDELYPDDWFDDDEPETKEVEEDDED